MGIGAGADILLLPLGAMFVLSIISVFAAFFSRPVAKAFAGLSVALAMLFLFVILVENHWNVAWLYFLLRQVSTPILVLYASLLLSAIAVWAPLRHRSSFISDIGQTPERPHWWLLALAASVTAVGVWHATAQLIDGRRGEEKTLALLAGDPNIRLRQLQINYQQRRVICTDPEVLRFIEMRFRTHEPHPKHLGTTYELTLAFDGGGAQAFASYWTDDGDFNLFIGDAGDGGTGHGIRLTSPRPLGIEKLVTFLSRPYCEVAGSVLILEANGSRVERDPSLVAH